MAFFTNYSELQATLLTWSDRPNIDPQEIISLAEAGLNRELETVETEATLAGAVSSRTIDTSSYTIVNPKRLWLTDLSSGDEEGVAKQAPGSFPLTDDNDKPTKFSWDDDTLTFNCPLDQAYSFRLRYEGRFALSDAVSTNELLTNHPDVYLGACMLWGGLKTQNDELVTRYANLLFNFVAKTRREQAQKKRGQLQPDPSIVRLTMGERSGWYDGTN